MYQIVSLSACLIMLFLHSAIAQTETKVSDVMLNDIYTHYKKAQETTTAQKAYYTTLQEKVAQITAQSKKWAEEKMQQQQFVIKSYKPGHIHKTGELNLFPLWQEIPGPISSLPEAKRADSRLQYQAYMDKVTMVRKEFSDMVKGHIDMQRNDQQSIMKDTKTAANNNAIVQQMGGADAVINMSEAERKQAAQNAAVAVLNNPGGQMTTVNTGVATMMKRVMNDPAYRDAYNKMSDAQKQEELKKYMSDQVVQRDEKAVEQSLKKRDDTYSAISIDNIIGGCLQKMQEAAGPYAEGTMLANDFYYAVYKDIAWWYKKQYDALPLSAQQEKIGLGILNKCRETIVYAFQQEEAIMRSILWNLLKTSIKIAFGEFNDLVGIYPWGKAKEESFIDYNYTEPRVANAVVSIYDEMIRLAKEAEMLTKDHKGKQEQFELIMK